MPGTLFIAGLITETNTFSPMPTSLAGYAETALFHGDATRHEPRWGVDALVEWTRLGRQYGLNVVEGLFAMAQPAGPTVEAAWRQLLDELIGGLVAAGPVDCVLLTLHGAMVATDCQDCEGAILARVREIVGPDVPVGVLLDLHCHVTGQMADNATVMVTYKEYPHVDVAERAVELFGICWRALGGAARPAMAIHDCRMVGIWPTTSEPMRGFVDGLRRAEREPGVLSVSLAHGFPWGDVADLGARVIVVTDNDPARSRAIAAAIGARFWALRDQLAFRRTDLASALEAARRGGSRPLVLADYADNPGGGAAGDSTFLLEALLRARVPGVALSSLWDPMAVRICVDAGAGARLRLRIGGKSGPSAGTPLDLDVTVRRVVPDATMRSMGGVSVRMGDAVLVEAAGTAIVINSIRTQTLGLDAFTVFGIEPASRQVLVVKSMQHFHHEFGPIAREVLYVDTPGTLSMDFAHMAYSRLNRPLWPMHAGPFDHALN